MPQRRAGAGGRELALLASASASAACVVSRSGSAHGKAAFLSAARQPARPSSLHGGQAARGPASEDAPSAARAAGCCAAVGLAALAASGRTHKHAGVGRPHHALTSLRAEGEGASEAEKIFREAYEAELERSKLLKTQLEAALSEKLRSEGGDAGMKITVEGLGPLSPEDTGGKATWREAYEEAKARTDSMEAQLKNAQGLGAARAPAPAPAPAPATAEPAKEPEAVGSAPSNSQDSGGSGFNPFGFLDPSVQSQASFKRLEELADDTLEDESALRLIAVPILGRRTPEEEQTRLPPLAQIRESIGTDQFSVGQAVEFERVYVLKGSVAAGSKPAPALEAIRSRLAGTQTEVFLQRAKKKGEQVLIVMLQEDLPKNEVQWWQWLIAAGAFVATLISVNITTFSVTTFTEEQYRAMSDEQMISVGLKTVPTAVAIMFTLICQEVVRRLVGGNYGVDFTPPFLAPVWPFPSVGSFGAISRRLSTVPNEEASLNISAATGAVGVLVSLILIAVGLSQGPDGVVNLNYQLLPVVLKLVLKPFLGQATLTDSPDPFLDPVNVAYPSNGIIVGGIISFIVVCLNLLPIGRLDGGYIAKGAFGQRNGVFAGFFATTVLLVCGTAPEQGGLLPVTFAAFAILFQGGSDIPPRDAISEPEDGSKALSAFLLLLGLVVLLPGSWFLQL